MHTENPTIKEKAATRNYEQEYPSSPTCSYSSGTCSEEDTGDLQLKKTLGKARRKGRDGAGITQAGGEGVGGGGSDGGGGGVEGGGGERKKGFVEAEVTFEMTPV